MMTKEAWLAIAIIGLFIWFKLSQNKKTTKEIQTVEAEVIQRGKP